MKALLTFIIRHVGFLYLNPRYRITDSSSRSLADIDASISFTSEQLNLDVINDRGTIYFAAAPRFQEVGRELFPISLIRQYLEGEIRVNPAASEEQANWLSTNLDRVEQLFADEPTTTRVCEELVALRRSNSSRKWGWPKP